MRNARILLVAVAAQLLLPGGMQACFCEPAQAQTQSHCCCGEPLSAECGCGCMVSVERHTEASKATLTQSHTPVVQVLLPVPASVQPPSFRGSAAVTDDAPHYAGLLLSLTRAERAPPA